MLDIDRLDRIRFTSVPKFQQNFARVFLAPQYKLFPGVKIRFEGAEHLNADEPMFIAMNHTDRYNYFPFQYHLWKSLNQFTAVWVKGKYYENRWVGEFMERANLIPTPSRGYVISTDFMHAIGRAPTNEEYAAIRGLLDRSAAGEQVEASEAGAAIPAQLVTQRRSILGREFHPDREDFIDALGKTFDEMMRRFVALNEQAFSVGLHTIVFPQGTRSIRLSRGHVGLAQMAMYLKRPILPVGCNGSDLVHPGDNPFVRKGEITYRIGEPIRPEAMQEFVPDSHFEPFTTHADVELRENFQGLTDVVMDRINELLEPRYQFAEDLESDGVKGTKRFI